MKQFATTPSHGKMHDLCSLPRNCNPCADVEVLQVAKMRALSSVVRAVAPALRSHAKALETALLTRVIFLEDGSVGCDARLAASQLLALLTQTAGPYFPFWREMGLDARLARDV